MFSLHLESIVQYQTFLQKVYYVKLNGIRIGLFSALYDARCNCQTFISLRFTTGSCCLLLLSIDMWIDWYVRKEMKFIFKTIKEIHTLEIAVLLSLNSTFLVFNAVRI